VAVLRPGLSVMNASFAILALSRRSFRVGVEDQGIGSNSKAKTKYRGSSPFDFAQNDNVFPCSIAFIN